MGKFFAGIAFYAVAIALIAFAMHIAPDMKWPANDIEMQAASLMILGVIAKTIGSTFLVTAANQ